ncbi:MAG: hypothetical protein Q9159_004549 [Coniocarpon cinnabarinum]
MDDDAEELLSAPSGDPPTPLTRSFSTYHPLHDFDLAKAEGYQQQYGDLYFLRLAKIKPEVQKIASEAWEGYSIADETVQHVNRVLDVRQGTLCWITGTIYLDMPLKPNILADIAADVHIAAPPPRERYADPRTGEDKVMLEDESGRLQLTEPVIYDHLLVTGVIVAVMGTENADGCFEVIDLKVAGAPLQPSPYTFEPAPSSQLSTDDFPRSSKIALVSGLRLTGDTGSTLPYTLLAEYLLGESATPSLQKNAASISRLIILGNSLSDSNPLGLRDDPFAPVSTASEKKKAAAHAQAKKYGYDASTYNPRPTEQLDNLLAELLPSLPVTIMPGDSDPANVSLPQQPLHPALFPRARAYADPPDPNAANAPAGTMGAKKKEKAPPSYPFHAATNPLSASIAGRLCLFTSGQPTADVAKYLPIGGGEEGIDDEEPSPCDLMEATLNWRIIAPTAPDTLWCYPYQNKDPFVLAKDRCPGLYAVGNAREFGTRVVRAGGWAKGQIGDEAEEEEEFEARTRLIAVPEFCRTGEIVVCDLEDLSVQVIKIGVVEPE